MRREISLRGLACAVFVGVMACASSTTTAPSADAGSDAKTDPCPEAPDTICQTDADCKCTLHCLPIVPNGTYKFCTIPCTTSADCNHPELGIGCTPNAQCCQAGNACMPTP